MKTGLEQLTTYAAYHRDRRNIATHVVGVPMIVFAVTVLLSRPVIEIAGLPVSVAWVAIALSSLYYIKLDSRLGLMLSLVLVFFGWAAAHVASMPTGIWLQVGLGCFIVGWIIQFIGHYFEGKKPAFVDDVVGLLIGPLFVLTEIAFAMGLRNELRAGIEARVGPTLIRQLT
jgi:uncharacterized membrane protein YGL010W